MRAICRRAVLVPCLLALAMLGVPVTVASPAAAAPASIYANAANWICRPDKSDVCDGNLNATVIQPNGQTSLERWAPAPNAPIDCFYLYPTSSWDWSANSDRYPGAWEEIASTRIQAARFGSACKVYAPVYRSVTSTWLISAYLSPAGLSTFPDALADVAYADVLAAWRHYLSADNGGRGFVLIGHSQGSEMLARLFDDEIRPNAALKARLVSALLIGLESDSHPDQSDLPSCTSPTQIGCHITYTSFRANIPPSADSIIARSNEPHDCTNPAALGGGRASLRSYFPTSAQRWLTNGRYISTPFVTVPGLVDAECVTRNGTTYLAIHVNARPSDPRADDVPGDLGGALNAEYGLHVSDVQLALGDLVSVVSRQAGAYLSR